MAMLVPLISPDNTKIDKGAGVSEVISYSSDGKPYSYYDDDQWVIFEENVDINFSRLKGHFKSRCKYLIYREFNNGQFLNKKSVGSKIIQTVALFQYCILEIGGDDFTFLNFDNGFRDFIEIAKAKKLKYKTWKNHLILFPLLHKYEIISRKLESADALAKVLAGNEIVQQTIALPENIASSYFKSALDVVSKYHSHRYLISEAYAEFISDYEKNITKGYAVAKARRLAQVGKNNKLEELDVIFDLQGGWLSWLRGACYIVIAAFTGCRDGEIKSFNLISYEEKEYAGMTIPILNGVDTKPNIGGVARNASWVTIPAVKLAIELVWEIYGFAREIWIEKANKLEHIDQRNKMIKQTHNLFISYTPTAVHPKAGRQAIDKSLKSFIRSTGYKARHEDVNDFNLLNPSRKGELKVGEVLLVNPHCFRRTFAVYLVRNKLVSLLDLKYQFKHMNIAMTSWYSNQANVASYFDMMLDKELRLDIAKENHDFMTDTLYYIYNDCSSLSGVEGKRIMALREGNKSSIYLSREEISQQVKKGQMSIIETPVGHCTNPQCNRICDQPECKYEVVTIDSALSLVSKRLSLIDRFKLLIEHGVKMPNILSKIFYEIKSIEKSLNEHNIKFETFKHDINVTLL